MRLKTPMTALRFGAWRSAVQIQNKLANNSIHEAIRPSGLFSHRKSYGHSIVSLEI